AILWTTDDRLRFTTSVGSGLAALGLAPNQVVGMPLADYLGEGGAVALEMHRLALAGQSASYEYDRAGRYYVVWVEPLHDAEGATCGTIGMAVDITRERQTDRALRESEARLRQVIDLVPHFIFAKDEQGRFLLANRAIAEAYGTTADRLLGRTDADFDSSEEEVRHFRDDDLEVMRTGQPKRIAEERITDAGGHVRWLQTLKIPFTFSGTGRPAVLGVATDITDRREAEEALRRAAKDESLTVLAGGVAHDFNNLLAAILGHASLAMKNLPPGSPARRHVEKAASAVERAADLTRQMLAYSGRGHFVVRPTDFNALIRENLPLLEVALPKSVRLATQLEPELPPVDADVGQIQQVLMNLVINAAEAIGPGGGIVTVSTRMRRVEPADSALWRASGHPLRPGQHVCLEVRDDGPGMDAATLERIFEPFFTTKFTGRGLGLAAVLGVVRGHRGALSVDSAPGRGTVFRLLFAPSEEAGEGWHPRPPAGAATDNRLTLLLVDDEEIVREMVSEVLAAEGHEVLCAEDGEKGVALFRDRWREIAAVLLDLSMPGLSGEETYARLTRIDPGVRVILSSGYDRDEATRRFGADQPFGFIQKPYRPQDLLGEIERCLSRGPAGHSSPGR
ncbi:MAG TPA: PAS domain-containing protein, partial [Vicinamibacteria bacterium]|nr:PAS domain-containing protein [Vicinamibacteria bacterium]